MNMRVSNTFYDLSIFSDSELHVVEYILSHMEEVSHMNIAELAKETYSSNGMIIRIARKVNCTGFKDLKLKLTQELERSRYVQEEVNFSFPFEIGETTNGILANLAALYRSAIHYTQPSISPSQCNRIVQQLLHAKRIFLFAVGDCEIVADSFTNKLKKLHIFAPLATLHGDQTVVAEGLTKDDITLFISYSGETNTLNTCLYPLKRNHVPIIALTGGKDSLLAKMADEKIIISPMEGNKEKISNFYSQFAFEYILNVIFSLMYNEVYQKKINKHA